LDSIIGIFKWTAPILSLFFVPPSILSLIDTVNMSFGSLNSLIPLLIGGVSYLVVSRIVVVRKKQGWFSTLEHELTHAFFALLTFHTISGIQTTATGGGVIHILGGNNWLILISPYFPY
jgi:hypothetical protein